jgi:hypothetical protein
MTKPFLALAGASVVLLALAAQAGDAGVEGAIRQFAAAFNKGDIAAAKALHVAAPVIIDEPAPPYMWTGPKAFDSWVADLTKSEAAEGKTEGQVAIGAPTREVVSSARAYVIVPSTYSFKQKGVVMREVAQMTFVLAKEKSGWKIAAWTWTGPDAKPLR